MSLLRWRKEGGAAVAVSCPRQQRRAGSTRVPLPAAAGYGDVMGRLCEAGLGWSQGVNVDFPPCVFDAIHVARLLCGRCGTGGRKLQHSGTALGALRWAVPCLRHTGGLQPHHPLSYTLRFPLGALPSRNRVWSPARLPRDERGRGEGAEAAGPGGLSRCPHREHFLQSPGVPLSPAPAWQGPEGTSSQWLEEKIHPFV